jgi:hypothetical protein
VSVEKTKALKKPTEQNTLNTPEYTFGGTVRFSASEGFNQEYTEQPHVQPACNLSTQQALGASLYSLRRRAAA